MLLLSNVPEVSRIWIGMWQSTTGLCWHLLFLCLFKVVEVHLQHWGMLGGSVPPLPSPPLSLALDPYCFLPVSSAKSYVVGLIVGIQPRASFQFSEVWMPLRWSSPRVVPFITKCLIVYPCLQPPPHILQMHVSPLRCVHHFSSLLLAVIVRLRVVAASRRVTHELSESL